jgi:hypothetical protein
MGFCEDCVARTPEAKEIVGKISGCEDVEFNVDEVANTFGADGATAQTVLNCLFNREFYECAEKQRYTITSN